MVNAWRTSLITKSAGGEEMTRGMCLRSSSIRLSATILWWLMINVSRLIQLRCRMRKRASRKPRLTIGCRVFIGKPRLANRNNMCPHLFRGLYHYVPPKDDYSAPISPICSDLPLP